MSMVRKTAKYGSAGVVTALFAAAIYTVSSGQEIKKAPPKQVIAVSAAMVALTWVVALA